MTFSTRLSLHALLILACGVAGYIAGSPADSPLSAPRLLKWKSAERGNGTDLRPRRVEDPILEFTRLLRGQHSRTDLLAVISRIPASAMPEAIRLLKERSAATALTERDPGNWEEEAAFNEIVSAVYFHWAEQDPQAALADAKTIESGQRRFIADSGALAAWMHTDPDAAFRAVKDDLKVFAIARDMIVRIWTPEDAFENAARYPEKQSDLLGWYGFCHTDSEVRREALLDGLRERKDLKDRQLIYSMLFRSWGYKNFDEAMTTAGKEKLPAVEKQLVTYTLGSPYVASVFQWASTHARLPEGAQWERGYGNWLAEDPGQARKWFAAESPKWEQSGRRDITAGFLAMDVNASRRQKDAAGETAASGALTRHWQAWRAADAKAADRWLETATPEIAKLLKGGTP